MNWSKNDSFRWLRYIPDDAVRDAFVRCCTEVSAHTVMDDDMLVRIALESRENGEALTAFRGICFLDAATVYKLSRYTWEPELRQLALNKLERLPEPGLSAPARRAPLEIESDPLRRLLRAGAEQPRLLYDLARGEEDAHRFFYKDSIPPTWHRVAAVCQAALCDPAWLRELAEMGGPVGLAALVHGADALDAGEILLSAGDKCVMRAAIDITDDAAALRAFARDRKNPYGVRMRAYAKLDDREALRDHAAKPYKWNQITWKYGYCMDSSNYVVITACRSAEQLNALYGLGYDHIVDRWKIRLASAVEDAASFNPPARGKAPDSCRGKLPPETLALCGRICRSADSGFIWEGLRAIRDQKEALFFCAVEGMAFCRRRSAQLLCNLPDAREELRFIALNESNPSVVNKTIDGLTDIDALKAVAERGLHNNTTDKAKCRMRALASKRQGGRVGKTE